MLLPFLCDQNTFKSVLCKQYKFPFSRTLTVLEYHNYPLICYEIAWSENKGIVSSFSQITEHLPKNVKQVKLPGTLQNHEYAYWFIGASPHV